MAPPVAASSGRAGGAGAHGAGEIDVDHLSEHGKVVLGVTVDDSGAVDQDIEAGKAAITEMTAASSRTSSATARCPACRDFRRRGAGNQHLAAERCESRGDAVTDAAGSADDQDAPAGEQAGGETVSG